MALQKCSVSTVQPIVTLRAASAVWRERVMAKHSSHLLRLVDKLFETPYLRIPMAQYFLGISYPAAQ